MKIFQSSTLSIAVLFACIQGMAQPYTATGTVTNVSCHGGNNGKIVYNVSGNPGPVYYRWNTGDSGLATGGCSYAVNINNPGAALSGFQVKVIVPLMAGMYANFSNVIFTDSAGNGVPFWLTDFPGVDTAVFWVRIPSVPVGQSQIFLSFCDANTVSAGTPDSVFEFFDDFDHAAYPWQDSTLNVVNGASGSMLYDDTTYFSASWSMRLIAGASCFLPPYSGGGEDAWLAVPIVNDSLVIDFDNKVETTLYGFCTGGTSTTNYVYADGNGLGTGLGEGESGNCASNISGWVDNTSSPFAVSTGSTTIDFRTYGGDCSYSDGWFDDIRIRKYRSNPPVEILDTTALLQLDNLTAGTYIITMHDSLGNISSTDTFVVTQPLALVVSTDSVNASCSSTVGEAWAVVNGGIPGYSYLWNNNAITDTITNLPAGNYLITVTDANGCTGSGSVSISSSGGIPPVTISSSKDSICSGDSVQICATSGFSTYAWNTGDTGACINTPYAGDYSVTAFESGNCSVSSNTIQISTFQPSPVTVSVNGDTLTSYSASSYQWLLNGVSISGANSSVYVALTSGIYSVEITDNHGCNATSSPITVTGIQNISADDVQIFPNPGNGYWQVTVNDELVGSYIAVFDATGRIVYKSIIANEHTTLTIPEIAAGVYELRINSGAYSIVKKLMKVPAF